MDRKNLLTLLLTFAVLVVVVLGVLVVVTISADGLPLGGHRVGVVRLQGPIQESRTVVEQLWELADGNVDALVLRIDSPGGAVGPSQEIYEAVQRVREETGKPVVASMGAVAASGGYYAALGCDRIVANPGTITGSIGVISQTMQVPELLDLAHLDSETFKSGALKDSGSPLRDLTDADRSLFRELIADIFDQFGAAVRERRGLDEAAFARVADGRVVSGRQAKELGLVDELGNLGRATRLALELAGVEGRPRIVRPKDDVPSWVRGLFADSVGQVTERLLSAGRGVRIELRAPVSTTP